MGNRTNQAVHYPDKIIDQGEINKKEEPGLNTIAKLFKGVPKETTGIANMEPLTYLYGLERAASLLNRLVELDI